MNIIDGGHAVAARDQLLCDRESLIALEAHAPFEQVQEIVNISSRRSAKLMRARPQNP